MRKNVTMLAFSWMLLWLGSPSLAHAEQTKARVRTETPVQTAPPAERPYGHRSVPQQPSGTRRGQRAPAPCHAYTELRIAPLFGGIAWVYDGDVLVGSIESVPGAIFLPEGRPYGVVVTRGDQIVWQGHVMATPGIVALSWDRDAMPVVDRVPPPPACRAYPPELDRPL